jgi:lipopolysaccharide heptosyltransferase I
MADMTKTLSDSPRFLICRLSAVGDTIHTLPLAHLIKQRWPKAFVAWVVQPGPAPLVQACSAVDEVVVAPKRFLRSTAELWQLRKCLRSLQIDIALDPQSLTKSAVLAWLSGARRRIGFARPIGRELSPSLNSERVVAAQRHVVRRYLEVLRPLGVAATADDVVFNVPQDTASEISVDGFLQSARIASDFAVINPGAGWDSKVWPAERFADVAAQLEIPTVVAWAGEKERAWAEQIVAGSHGRATLAPPTSLLQLAALLRRAQLFIGSDTGPLHLAAAVETRCVALFGPTQPEVCGPYGPGHVVLQSASESLGGESLRRARKAAGQSSAAMLQITAAQVVAACEQVLCRTTSCAA